jgi:serine/threonine protein kinase
VSRTEDGPRPAAAAPSYGDSHIPPGPRPPGTVVSEKFRLVRQIARGGMGDVYEAEHLVIRRRVAIKFLHPRLARDEVFVRRLRLEAEAAGRLRSEFIAMVTDFDWAAPGDPYLVMELLEGRDLAQELAHGPLAVPAAVQTAVQICRGLTVAHGQGFLHRDLKPANVFLCAGGDGAPRVKILDFGIAKAPRDEGSPELTGPRDTMGTPYYMAPEQVGGLGELDARTDLYALGVMLYEMLSGTKPHPGRSSNEVIHHLLTRRPEPLENLRPGLPPALTAIVARAMAFDAIDRYASARALEEALRAFRAPGGAVEMVAPPTPALPPTSLPRTLEAVSTRLARVPRRRRTRAWLLVLGLAALAVGGGWLMARSHRPVPRAESHPKELRVLPLPRVAPPPGPSPSSPQPTVAASAPATEARRRRPRRRPSETPPPAPIQATPTPSAAEPAAAEAAPSPFERKNPYE